MTALQLAINQRTTTKASIRRGSAAARRKMDALDAVALAQLEAIYEQAREEIESAILSYADKEGTLRLEVLQSLLAQVGDRLGRLSKARNSLLDGHLISAAELGVAPYGDQLASVAHQAAQFVRTFQAEDGLTLSDRLWRIDQGAREAVGRAIQVALVQGNDASRAAQEFLRKKVTVPADLTAKIKAAGAEQLAGAAGRALLQDEGNAYDAARRVFRTELNRAHGEAYMAGGESVEGFAGWRFLLSPGHPRPDICDMHAKANLHGLGAGVYPSRERCPWPAHPNTLSYVEIVFQDEITDVDRAGRTDRMTWLKRQSPGMQQSVLNGTMKRAALEAGLLQENQIATPWRVLKVRFAAQGMDLSALKPSTPRIGEWAVGERRPVSAAIDALQHRDLSARVLGVVDQVHGDGRLPTIPLRGSSATDHLGVYRFHRLHGTPVDIRMADNGTHKDLTLAHELGHFLDHQGIAPGHWASKESPVFQAWREAVDKSEAVRTLKALRKQPDFEFKRYTRYLLEREEIWARSYAQYIATKSGNEEMLAQLAHILERRGTTYIPRQWDHEDFKPVMEAIDAAFKELGWIDA